MATTAFCSQAVAHITVNATSAVTVYTIYFLGHPSERCFRNQIDVFENGVQHVSEVNITLEYSIPYILKLLGVQVQSPNEAFRLRNVLPFFRSSRFMLLLIDLNSSVK